LKVTCITKQPILLSSSAFLIVKKNVL